MHHIFMKLILASHSPRRKELLAGLEYPFEVRVMSDIDERYPETLQGEEIPIYISAQKAKAYLPTLAADELLITADTVAMSEGRVLGKPHDREDAIRMLTDLSGRTHEVITGVTLATVESQKSFASVSRVTFASLHPDDIIHYVDHYRPFDKAGAYGIQEWIGFIGVTRIEGSYFNVMGLPVQRLYEELRRFCGVDLTK